MWRPHKMRFSEIFLYSCTLWMLMSRPVNETIRLRVSFLFVSNLKLFYEKPKIKLALIFS